MKRVLLLITCVILSWNASALEVEGITLPESVHLGSRDLVLNGAGVRVKYFFKIYVAALYLGEKTHVANVALSQPGEKRIALYVLHELTDEVMLQAFTHAMSENCTHAEMDALEPQLKELTAIFRAVGDVRKGDLVEINYIPDSGTQIVVNGVQKGKIAGAVFNRALLKAWLGDKPSQPSLKQQMLDL